MDFIIKSTKDSDLHYSIISLFSDVMYRFPYMIVSQMSRDSILRSAAYGITAKQILHYLNTSCHPACKKNLHPIPQVVSDNVHIWCDERNRLKFKEGTLYNQFLTQEDFETLRDYANGKLQRNNLFFNKTFRYKCSNLGVTREKIHGGYVRLT